MTTIGYVIIWAYTSIAPQLDRRSESAIYSKDTESFAIHRIIQGVSKRALQIWKRIEIYTEDIHNVLNCQNVAKHTEFYLG